MTEIRLMRDFRRHARFAMRGALVLVTVTGLTASSCRKSATPVPPSPPSESAAVVASAPPLEDVNVLVYLESTPPGAAIRRLSTNSVVGYTPETVQLRRSNVPEQFRFELEGHQPVSRDISAAADSQLMVVLRPAGRERAADSLNSPDR